MQHSLKSRHRLRDGRETRDDSPGGLLGGNDEGCLAVGEVGDLEGIGGRLTGRTDPPGGLLGGNDECCLAVGEVGDLEGIGGRLTGRTAGWE